MRSARPALFLSLCLLFADPLRAQTPTPTPSVDPQAVAILQQAVKAMGGSVPSDSTANGIVQTVAGGQTNQGTIQILTKGTAETLFQMTMPDATQTTIYSNGQANDRVGSTVTVLPLELVVTSQAAEFPLPLLGALLNNADMSFQYVGLEALNGASVHHIKAWDSFASQPNWQQCSSFSTRDIWVDATSLLPQRISFTRRPAHGAVAGMAVDVYFAGYQYWGGILYPSTIQKSRNGTQWATISIQSVALNTGLTDENFPVQSQ